MGKKENSYFKKFIIIRLLLFIEIFFDIMSKKLEVKDMFMPLADKLLGLLFGGILCAIFGYVVYILSKKQKEQTAEIVNALTADQKEELMSASMSNCSFTKGLIAVEPKVGANKTQLKVLVYNMYYPNMMKEYLLADVSISTKQYNEYNIKQGDYIAVTLDENGAKAVLE